MQYLIALAKTALVFIALWAITRRLSKHLIRRITLFDFITSIVMGTLAGSVISRNQPPAVIMASVAFWAGLTMVFDWIAMRGRGIRSFLNGDPIVLIENGKIMEENLRRERVTVKQLESQLRLKGYFDLSQVEMCLMEINGQISVCPRSQNRPVQPSDLGLSTRYEALSTQLIHEGRPLIRELQGLGLSEAWLTDRLTEQGISRLEDVFGAWFTSDGRLVVDRYDDRPH